MKRYHHTRRVSQNESLPLSVGEGVTLGVDGKKNEKKIEKYYNHIISIHKKQKKNLI